MQNRPVAAVLEQLELRQPSVVTRSLLADLLTQSQTQLAPEAAGERLVRLGWLLPLLRPAPAGSVRATPESNYARC